MNAIKMWACLRCNWLNRMPDKVCQNCGWVPSTEPGAAQPRIVVKELHHEAFEVPTQAQIEAARKAFSAATGLPPAHNGAWVAALTAAAGAEKPSGPRVRFRCMTCGALSGDDAYDDCAEVAQWQCFECSIK